MMPQGYEIARPTGQCAASGRPIAVGDHFMAALAEPADPDGPAALARFDYSIAAWEQGARPHGLFACWRARMPEPREKKKALVEDEELAQLFDQLGEGDPEGAERRERFRYVLAWLLVRRKLMQYGGSAGGVMRIRRSGSLASGPQRDEPWIEIADPGMSDQQLASATRDLAIAIFGEDDPQEAAEPTAEEPES